MTDPSNPFYDCLVDSQGIPLRYTPDNHPTPPAGDGTQLSFRAIPHYESAVKQRDQSQGVIQHNLQCQFCQSQHKKVCKSCKCCPVGDLLKAKNIPIPIKDENELAHLYLQEFYNKQPSCNILNLDAGAILNILSKAECFPDNIRKQAARVRDEVRNKWAHAIVNDWTSTKLTDAFHEMTTFVKMLPTNAGVIQELKEDLLELRVFEFPKKNFLLKIDKFRTTVKDGKHQKVQDRIKRLANLQKSEVYLERKFKDSATGKETSKIEDFVLEDSTTLLQGEAGSGKSSVAAKAMQKWADGQHMKDITCCLFLAAGSEKEIPLCKIVWDEYNEVQKWTDSEAKEVFQQLQHMADEGKLAIIIDGLDELGAMKMKDLSNARRAANHSPLEVDMRTACVGILSKIILPGAKVFATGRNTELVNNDILAGLASVKELVELSVSDRENLIEMMEMDVAERLRIQEELERVSLSGNNYFLRTPLMTRVIIQLIVKKFVDIEKVNNSSDIFLMVVLRNLDFHANLNTNFLELDPPEDHRYLVMCLMLCQMQIQSTEGDTSNIIKGIQRNVENVGLCFEKKALGETIRVPVEFIKKLGIFEYRKEGGKAYLEAVHLSFLEFGCAASLCRNGVNIQQELAKIQDKVRFQAVAIYLAGLFSENSSIDFLNTCKDLCHNFLDLLSNQERESSIQDTLQSIMKYPLSQDIKVIVSTQKDEIIKRKRKIRKSRTVGEMRGLATIELLVKAMVAAGASISNLNITKISLPSVKDWRAYRCVAKLIEFQKQEEIDQLEIMDMSSFRVTDTMLHLLKVSKHWEITQHHYPTLQLKGQRLDSINQGTIALWALCSVSSFVELLGAVQAWKVDSLDLIDPTQEDWAMLAGAIENGNLGTINLRQSIYTLRTANSKDICTIWKSTDKWQLFGGDNRAVFKNCGVNGLNKLFAMKKTVNKELSDKSRSRRFPQVSMEVAEDSDIEIIDETHIKTNHPMVVDSIVLLDSSDDEDNTGTSMGAPIKVEPSNQRWDPDEVINISSDEEMT